MPQTDSKLILQTNLRTYFFESLSSINAESICPMPESLIYYSSDLLERFSLSEDYFEIQEGKVREKILGMKLLESTNLSSVEQVRVLRDVADTSLLVSSYFSDSLRKKVVDASYYSNIGKNAYERLNNVSPHYLDIPSFYHMLATSFDRVGLLLKKLSVQSFNTKEQSLFDSYELFNRKVS